MFLSFSSKICWFCQNVSSLQHKNDRIRPKFPLGMRPREKFPFFTVPSIQRLGFGGPPKCLVYVISNRTLDPDRLLDLLNFLSLDSLISQICLVLRYLLVHFFSLLNFKTICENFQFMLQLYQDRTTTMFQSYRYKYGTIIQIGCIPQHRLIHLICAFSSLMAAPLFRDKVIFQGNTSAQRSNQLIICGGGDIALFIRQRVAS